MKNQEFVSYIDTDSLFIRLGYFLEKQGVDISKWDNVNQKTKVKYLLKLSKHIENNINDRMFKETQCQDYTSAVERDDFTIGFKQEIVCDNALHITPKMYAFHVINEEGFDCDKIDAKGIETVRSSSPKVFRKALKGLLKIILSGGNDEELIEYVEKQKEPFYSSRVEDISVNIGVNNIRKYQTPDGYKKGTPYQSKGAIWYHYLIDKFNLGNRYEPIHEGDKCKFAYVKKNMYGIQGVTYFNWPKEFTDKGILADYDIMIQKYFVEKAKILLIAMNRESVLETSNNSENDFF